MSTPRPDINTALLKFLAAAPERQPEIIVSAPPLLVRTAQLHDLHELSDILVRGFHSPEGWMKWVLPVMRLGIYEDLRYRLQNQASHYACLVAIHSSEAQSSTLSPGRHHPAGAVQVDAIGTVEVSVRQRSLWHPQSRYIYLSNLAVRADFRRQGVASQLLKGCEAIAHRWGFRDIYLHVLENNEGARGLYQRLGYQIKQSDADLMSWVFRRPRQLLLYKQLPLS